MHRSEGDHVRRLVPGGALLFGLVESRPDEAMLREAKRGYDLIVLGVSPRPGASIILRQHGYIDTRPLGHVQSVRGELSRDEQGY